jgi:hypothetical protein
MIDGYIGQLARRAGYLDTPGEVYLPDEIVDQAATDCLDFKTHAGAIAVRWIEAQGIGLENGWMRIGRTFADVRSGHEDGNFIQQKDGADYFTGEALNVLASAFKPYKLVINDDIWSVNIG